MAPIPHRTVASSPLKFRLPAVESIVRFRQWRTGERYSAPAVARHVEVVRGNALVRARSCEPAGCRLRRRRWESTIDTEETAGRQPLGEETAGFRRITNGPTG